MKEMKTLTSKSGVTYEVVDDRLRKKVDSLGLSVNEEGYLCVEVKQDDEEDTNS